MDRWKAEQGRGREKRKIRRKEDGDARKGRKVAKHCVFPMIWGSGGSKSRLAKRVRSQLARWEMKSCTPLWREAHFQVKMYKTLGVRTTFGSWDVEKVHAVVARSTFPSQNVQSTRGADHFWQLRVARSTFPSQNVQSTPLSDHFWKLRCRKRARRCGAKHISKSKVQKTDGYGALLDVQMCFRVAGARDCAPWQKWAKREGFVAFPKTLAGVGHWKRIFKDAFRVAGAVQKTCSSEMLGGQGADFLRRVAFWSIRSSGLWPGINFSRQAQYFTQVEWKDRKTYWYESVSSALNFPFLKEVSQNSSFLMACTSKNEEVSQNCFVSDVVKFKKWRRLAELFRFGRSYVQTLRKSRRISSLLILHIDRSIDR